ncbi:MAG: hypothetical protein QXH02_02080 [Desulfurococcaceae archaeon]
MSSDYVLDLYCAGLNPYHYILAMYGGFSRIKTLTGTISWDTVVESTRLCGRRGNSQNMLLVM